MAEPSMTTVGPAEEQTPADDPRLAAWERRMNPVIMAAALVPIMIALTPRGAGDPLVLIDVASWLVFLVDFGVHLRFKRSYLRTGLGKFDGVIVVLTFPWYLIPGFGGAAVLGLARLGRVLRLALAGGATGVLRKLIERLGKAGLYSLVLIFVCSVVVHRVEPPSSGFTDVGDSLWWGFVTFTTVGYGDLVPVTTTGRVVAVMLMIGGVALIGLLAASLADFLSPDGGSDGSSDVSGGTADATGASGPVDDELLVEVRALRAELSELRVALEQGTNPGSPPG